MIRSYQTTDLRVKNIYRTSIVETSEEIADFTFLIVVKHSKTSYYGMVSVMASGTSAPLTVRSYLPDHLLED